MDGKQRDEVSSIFEGNTDKGYNSYKPLYNQNYDSTYGYYSNYNDKPTSYGHKTFKQPIYVDAPTYHIDVKPKKLFKPKLFHDFGLDLG